MRRFWIVQRTFYRSIECPSPPDREYDRRCAGKKYSKMIHQCLNSSGIAVVTKAARLFSRFIRHCT